MVKSRKKTQFRENLSQQFDHKQVPNGDLPNRMHCNDPFMEAVIMNNHNDIILII